MVSKKEILKRLTIVGYIFTFFLVGSLLVVTISYFLIEEQIDAGVEFHEYKYIQINKETNDISYGFRTIPKKLKPDEFQSYQDRKGYHVLVSNFETEEFECTGSCYCDEKDDRKTYSSAIQKGSIYLVAAASAIIAVKYAKTHFEEKCLDSFSSDQNCPPSQIVSNVDHCMPAIPFNIRLGVDLKEKSEYELDIDHSHPTMQFEDDSMVTMLCKGFCVMNYQNDRDRKFYFPDDADKCRALEKVAIVKIYRSGKDDKGMNFKDYKRARKKFRLLHLVEYCSNDVDYGGGMFSSSRFDCYAGKEHIDENVHCRRANSGEKATIEKRIKKLRARELEKFAEYDAEP